MNPKCDICKAEMPEGMRKQPGESGYVIQNNQGLPEIFGWRCPDCTKEHGRIQPPQTLINPENSIESWIGPGKTAANKLPEPVLAFPVRMGKSNPLEIVDANGHTVCRFEKGLAILAAHFCQELNRSRSLLFSGA